MPGALGVPLPSGLGAALPAALAAAAAAADGAGGSLHRDSNNRPTGDGAGQGRNCRGCHTAEPAAGRALALCSEPA